MKYTKLILAVLLVAGHLHAMDKQQKKTDTRSSMTLRLLELFFQNPADDSVRRHIETTLIVSVASSISEHETFETWYDEVETLLLNKQHELKIQADKTQQTKDRWHLNGAGLMLKSVQDLKKSWYRPRKEQRVHPSFDAEKLQRKLNYLAASIASKAEEAEKKEANDEGCVIGMGNTSPLQKETQSLLQLTGNTGSAESRNKNTVAQDALGDGAGQRETQKVESDDAPLRRFLAMQQATADYGEQSSESKKTGSKESGVDTTTSEESVQRVKGSQQNEHNGGEPADEEQENPAVRHLLLYYNGQLKNAGSLSNILHTTYENLPKSNVALSAAGIGVLQYVRQRPAISRIPLARRVATGMQYMLGIQGAVQLGRAARQTYTQVQLTKAGVRQQLATLQAQNSVQR
ncbi:MAG TPA: hypothetical protein VGT41_00370 [Candidatus Babeliales bacterium]|nr:hypothetical protein [Candidatus Babeliales bacterium]